MHFVLPAVSWGLLVCAAQDVLLGRVWVQRISRPELEAMADSQVEFLRKLISETVPARGYCPRRFAERPWFHICATHQGQLPMAEQPRQSL